MNKMKNIYVIVALIFMGISFTSCSDFLRRDTYDKIGSEEFWKSETDIELYAMGFLQNMIPGDGTVTRGDANTDYCAQVMAHDLIRPDGNISPETQGGWAESSWRNLRRINYMLDNMHKCKGVVTDELYNHYEGVARFWRAWFYYDKVRTFGAVPWYEHVIASSDKEALMKPRDSREYVMDKVLEDLNFASENCLTSAKFVAGSNVINKWTALAFKSRVCLFEGTYRKYHNVDPSTGQAWDPAYNANNKFLREAASAAKELMDTSPFKLVTGDPKTAYRSIFTSAKILTDEVIFGREYSQELGAFHEASWVFFSPTYGTKISMVKTFVDTYLMDDGTPFTSKANYDKVEFTNEFKNRDPRMAQTILSPSYTQKRGGIVTSVMPSWQLTRTGYHPIKWVIDDDSNGMFTTARSWNSLPILRYGEVLLNYAEAMAELGEFDENIWNMTIRHLRERAGVTSVIPATPDPYMQAYFLNSNLDKWQLEIRRERGVELCMEMGLRWDDLMRWKMGDLLSSQNNPWRGVYLGSTNYSADFNGDGKIDLEIKAGNDTPTSIAILGTGANQTFSLGADGNLVYEYARVWTDQKYLRPIPIGAITRNPNIEQNVLWK